tara:strand:+ start:1255 stop:1404 length:150 start_codon:yes stop_codon:yes gene_type:complete
MIYTQLFPEGLSIDMPTEAIYQELLSAEEWDVEEVEEYEIEEGDGEDHY